MLEDRHGLPIWLVRVGGGRRQFDRLRRLIESVTQTGLI
jgi:hypothetical protein